MKYAVIIFDVRLWTQDCRRISKKDLQRIIEKIQHLEEWPVSANVDVKALQHYDAANYRLRVGTYRILFNVDHTAKKIFVLRVLHRSKLY
jgi:mRNA interferase RelE/StbE